jgi:outer membrane lipoprotein
MTHPSLRWLPTLALVVLAGCATVPEPLSGEFVGGEPSAGVAQGQRVRWGGNIIAVEPEATRTCFQVLARELGDNARPRLGDRSSGRFLACREGFYDPAVFTSGRELTVVGTLSGTETRRVGEYDYPLPRVAADVVYLWPERPERLYVYDPFWPHWWGFYGPFGSFHYYRPFPRSAPEPEPQPAPPEKSQ